MQDDDIEAKNSFENPDRVVLKPGAIVDINDCILTTIPNRVPIACCAAIQALNEESMKKSFFSSFYVYACLPAALKDLEKHINIQILRIMEADGAMKRDQYAYNLAGNMPQYWGLEMS